MIPASIWLVFGMAAASVVFFLRNPIPDIKIERIPDDRVEELRRIIIEHTGREIGELRLIGGHWHGLTVSGWRPVTDILKDAKNPGAKRGAA